MKWRAFGRTPQWVRLSDWLASTAAEALAVSWRGHAPIEAANGERCKSDLLCARRFAGAWTAGAPYGLAYRARQDLLGRGVNPCDTVGSSAGALKGEPATPEPLGPDEMRNDS